MKVGVAGPGLMAFWVAPSIVELGIEVGAVCGTPESIDRARELCEKCGTSAENAYADYDLMLAEADIDTVYIALPNHLHYPFSLKAMEAGKNVVVEKPFASNDREAAHLAEVARENGVYLWEAVSTPHQPGLAKIREWLPRIGRVKVVSCNYSQYSRRYDQFRQGTVLPVFSPKAAGGAMMDLGLYNTHYLVGLFGEPNGVAYHANVEKDIDVSGIATYDYDGFQAVGICAKDCGSPSWTSVQGEDGYIYTDTPANLMTMVTLHLNHGTEEEFVDDCTTNWVYEWGLFLKDLESGSTERCYKALDTTLAVARTLTRARLSAGVRFPADEE